MAKWAHEGSLVRFVSAFCVLFLAGPAQADVLHHWTQLIADKTQSFRAIVDDAQCPQIDIDGTRTQMGVRIGPTADFPNLVCTYDTRLPVVSVTLGSRNFPLRSATVDRILVVGDTGCRLKQGKPIQACNDPVAWPFAKIARAVADKDADIAIHVGDYHYRETECPEPDKCGTIHGNNWSAWEVDFFAPGQVMLSKHPFVFVRGNHEDCDRAWFGYLRYLAAEPVRTPIMCDNYQKPFVIRFDDLQLAVVDSSTRNRENYTRDRLRAMRRQFMDVLPQLDSETLLVTHTPLWGYGSKETNATDLGTLESIQREAFGAILPRLVSAVVAGDLHFAQIVDTPGNPVQITFGNGGVALYTTPHGRVDDLPVGKDVTGDLFGYNQFGFGVIDRSDSGLDVTFFDADGAIAAKCLPPTAVDSCALD